ncbi:long-chain fatty acid--CoA ligase [bacterium]|nr:long-chain fatty acid--CoA ligase [bacterium]
MKSSVNVGAFLAKRALLSPNKLAVVCENVRLTFREANARANQLAAAMRSIGIKQGDRVGVMALNEPEFVDIFFGLGKIGAIMVPVNFRLAGPEVQYILENAEAKILIFSKEFQDTIDGYRNILSPEKYIVIADDSPDWADSYKEFVSGHSTDEPEIVGCDNDTLAILYTSGTTGKPKGAQLTHESMFWVAVTMSGTLGEVGDKGLITLPLFHIGALAFFPLSVHSGKTMVLMRSFDPQLFLENLGKEKISFIGIVPVMLMFIRAIPDYDKYDWSSLKLMLVYASPVPVSLIKEYFDAGIEVRQLYGMTEVSGPATVIDSENALKKAGSCGLPFFHTDIRIIDDNGNDVPPNVNGEIIMKSPNNMKGYWKRPEADKETIKDGWIYSGDIAKMDEDGFIYIMDRKKDMIISGGENIYPAEIEDVLLTHPKIADASVIGYPHEKWQEAVKAIITIKPNEKLTEEELVEWCQGKLGRFKIPKKVVFTDNIPRTPTGKVLKRILREMYN